MKKIGKERKWAKNRRCGPVRSFPCMGGKLGNVSVIYTYIFNKTLEKIIELVQNFIIL